jgi:hypothetical protein
MKRIIITQKIKLLPLNNEDADGLALETSKNHLTTA